VKQGPAFADGGAFREIFFEEAQEHLANTEAILLGLDTQAPSPDDLNAIFRAVHSIKGSAAMLGFEEIAALAHVFENLLDLLRKDERPLEKADVDAMLEAGDVAKNQLAHRRGLLAQLPDPAAAAAALRERVAFGASGAGARASRCFGVRLGPLAAPIDGPDLEMMLAGLAEMGQLANQRVDNHPGGAVCFDVSLEGTETDLRSVLCLVVPPELVAVHERQAGAPPAGDDCPGALPPSGATPRLPPHLPHEVSELFVDPEEFKRNGARRAVVAAAQAPAAPVAPAAAGRAVREAAAGAAPGAASSIRVATEKIDLLVNLVGELVITESMLSRHGGLAEHGAGHGAPSGLADLARNTRDLQEAVLAIRMVPIADVFARFPRLVRELSGRLGKKVQLVTSGESTELDRGLIEKITDPLTHLVRNAVDHGLEPPEARVAAGKDPVGTVRLAASQRGGKVVIEVGDDGRGLDRQRILARAAERGRAFPPDVPDAQLWPLLFEAGFSTVEQVTDVSGRGVGMDVVRRNILSLGGSVDVASQPGRGLRVTMTVPLTLAIMEAMTVLLGRQIYVLPLASVVESRCLASGDIHVLPGRGETLCVRGAYLPVLRLGELFPTGDPRPQADAIAVIVEAQGAYAAVLVDALVGQQQVVVKSLETNFRKVPGVAGATIMSDGSVALILDVAHLTQTGSAARVPAF
jgi:two-component system chemotaxis sensor kinase CheA